MLSFNAPENERLTDLLKNCEMTWAKLKPDFDRMALLLRVSPRHDTFRDGLNGCKLQCKERHRKTTKTNEAFPIGVTFGIADIKPHFS